VTCRQEAKIERREVLCRDSENGSADQEQQQILNNSKKWAVVIALQKDTADWMLLAFKGDQIGRILAFWVKVYFEHFFDNSSPNFLAPFSTLKIVH
jgi:hypothetical protein